MDISRCDRNSRSRSPKRSQNFERDRPILGKMGAGTSPAERDFFCLVNHATSWQLATADFHQIWPRNAPRWIQKDIFENFHFRGHLPPKSEIKTRSHWHLTQSRLQVTWCTSERYYLCHVVVQGPGSFRDRSTFQYDVRLRGVKVA